MRYSFTVILDASSTSLPNIQSTVTDLQQPQALSKTVLWFRGTDLTAEKRSGWEGTGGPIRPRASWMLLSKPRHTSAPQFPLCKMNVNHLAHNTR